MKCGEKNDLPCLTPLIVASCHDVMVLVCVVITVEELMVSVHDGHLIDLKITQRVVAMGVISERLSFYRSSPV